jgi:hypothetical protein
MENESNHVIFQDSMFETMFKWKKEWAAIIVKPMLHEGKLLHYIVKWVGGPVFFLWKNSQGEWEELKKGSTDRSRAAGKAIEYSYMLV